MKAIFVIAGAVIGLLIVRGFMLDAFEEIAWRIFWSELFKGNISGKGMGEVFQSATFIKSIIGVIVGAVLGTVAAGKFSAQNNPAPVVSESNEVESNSSNSTGKQSPTYGFDPTKVTKNE